MNGHENLIPINTRSKEEARQISSRGGINSGAARRARKTLRESLNELLASKIPKDSPHYLRLKGAMEALGMKGQPDVQAMTTIGIVQKAAKGDSAAFAIMRDTIGEKPVEQQEIINPPEPIVLGLIPQAEVDKANKEREENHNGK